MKYNCNLLEHANTIKDIQTLAREPFYNQFPTLSLKKSLKLKTAMAFQVVILT